MSLKINKFLQSGQVWTYSNLLSLSRLFLGFLLFYSISHKQTHVSISLAVLAVISDYADGYLARKRNEISELGKILDPLADKITVALGAIALYKVYSLPLWIVILIIGRDILILAGSVILMERLQNVVASELPGKIAVTIIAMLLLTYLLEWHILKPYLLIFAVLAIFISFLFYVLRFIKIFIKYENG